MELHKWSFNSPPDSKPTAARLSADEDELTVGASVETRWKEPV